MTGSCCTLLSIVPSKRGQSSLRDLLLKMLLVAKTKVAGITDCHASRRGHNPSNSCQYSRMTSDCSISQDSHSFAKYLLCRQGKLRKVTSKIIVQGISYTRQSVELITTQVPT